MSDIIERLRIQALRDGPSELHKEAADTIEALRRERDMWKETDLRDAKRIDELAEQLASVTAERDTFKASYLEQVELHNKTLDELREMERELDELEGANILNRNAVQFQKDKLATSQAREQRLRDALVAAQGTWGLPFFPSLQINEALAIPQDTTALNAWGAKLLRDAAKNVTANETPASIRTVLNILADGLKAYGKP